MNAQETLSKDDGRKCQIILINPLNFTHQDKPMPPFQYMFLAPRLASEGYCVKVIDLQTEPPEILGELLDSEDLIWIGFSIMTGPPIASCLNVAKTIKKYRPEIPLVWGGAHSTLLPEQTLENPCVDIVVVGEGERTVVELSHALKHGRRLEKVKGIGFKRDGIKINPPREVITDWDSEVELDWSYIDYRKYVREREGYKNMPFISSRGCVFKCGFCYNAKVNKQQWRGWSAGGTIKELEKLLDLGINSITFMDDLLTLDIERLKEIVTHLGERNVRVGFDGGFRIDSVRHESLYKTLDRTGCRHFQYGAESGSQNILDRIKKGITLEQIIESARLTRKYNLGATYNWMIGFPGESQKDIQETLDMVDKITEINPNTSHVFALYSPYPGQALYEDAIRLRWEPPKRLEDWDKAREDADYSYVNNMWYLRCIALSCYFNFSYNVPSYDMRVNNLLLRFIASVMKIISTLRWRSKFFGFPLECMLVIKGRAIVDDLFIKKVAWRLRLSGRRKKHTAQGVSG